jgi:hypothetical protein
MRHSIVGANMPPGRYYVRRADDISALGIHVKVCSAVQCRRGPRRLIGDAAKVNRRGVPARFRNAVGLHAKHAGYHVSDGKAYYLNAFPGKAFEMSDADAASFRALGSTYGRDKSKIFVNGHPLPDADAASFALLNRPNFAEDNRLVYQRDRVISDDPAHFELLEGGLAKDSHVVY